jgi:hypothetical protein
VAVERGPIVYCFEQADLADGVELAAVAINPTAVPADGDPQAELDGVPTVAVAAAVNELDGWQDAIYRDAPTVGVTTAGSATELQAVPYFTWANRRTGAMRVWTPAAK